MWHLKLESNLPQETKNASDGIGSCTATAKLMKKKGFT
jgi:hypothetical protein